MSLEIQLQAAYDAQEDTETAAREIEARIRQIPGTKGLLPSRQYGREVDRVAIANSLTLRSLIARHDRHLAAYLGVSMDNRKADAEAEARKMQAERMRLETERLRTSNQAAALRRERNLIQGLRPDGRRFI